MLIAWNHAMTRIEALSCGPTYEKICPSRRTIIFGTDQNSGFIFTIDDESKGLDMKGDSEVGLALGVGALCKAEIGKLL
jgi:hypothetical protein